MNEDKGEETYKTFAVRANLIGTAILVVTIVKDVLSAFISCIWIDRGTGIIVLGVIILIIKILTPSRIDTIIRSKTMGVFDRKKVFETFTVFSAVIYGVENLFGKETVEFIRDGKLNVSVVIFVLLGGLAFAAGLLIYKHHEDKKVITEKSGTNTVDIGVNVDTDINTDIDIDVNIDADTDIDINVNADANTNIDISIDIDIGVTTSDIT